MKIGSLFDGIGGFPLVASWYGIEAAWASEIEPSPISITKRHFPNMRHLGDITKINGAEIEPADIITFGSPCQDLSVAGKRAGLAGARSGLFGEAIRIIEEMMEATNGLYPTWAIWENVPGALSSNDGLDFRAVLQSFADTEISMPNSGRCGGLDWCEADDVTSDGESWMPNFGESPNVARESLLSQILEDNVPQKYYLSPKACEGILRRAERRGKELPPMLEAALLRQASLTKPELGQEVQDMQLSVL